MFKTNKKIYRYLFIHVQSGAALIHHFDLCSTREAPEKAWTLKFAIGSARDGI